MNFLNEISQLKHKYNGLQNELTRVREETEDAIKVYSEMNPSMTVVIEAALDIARDMTKDMLKQ